jgi:hypothetical protein
VHLNLEQSDILDVETIVFNLDTIAIRRESNRIKPVTSFEPWEASLITSFNPAKKRFETLIQSLEHILGRTKIKLGELWNLISHFFELIGLVAVIQGFMLVFPRITALLEGGII